MIEYYTGPILPKDSKIIYDMDLNLNELCVHKPIFHLDLMIMFIMKDIFLKCRISMFFSLLYIKTVRNDPMVCTKMGLLNENIQLS